jgi:hypothetical protein
MQMTSKMKRSSLDIVVVVGVCVAVAPRVSRPGDAGSQKPGAEATPPAISGAESGQRSHRLIGSEKVYASVLLGWAAARK